MFFNSLRLSRKVISEYIPVVLLQIYKTTIQIANIYTLKTVSVFINERFLKRFVDHFIFSNIYFVPFYFHSHDVIIDSYMNIHSLFNGGLSYEYS